MTTQPEQTMLPRKSSGARVRTLSAAQTEQLRAPFALRCGALLIDYSLLAGILACSTIFAGVLGGNARTAGGAANTLGWLIVVGVGFLNFVVFAGTRGRTLGKWATGIHIERTNGALPGMGHTALRHLIGYPLSLIVFGIGFLLAAFDARGRALHDRLAGTLVVRDVEQRRRIVR
ncbi:MAG: RDD family protein [Pyrinomonadaceae bacterium]